MKELYIVRHGQTDFNLKGIVQGRGVDADLNDTGRLQAKAFYEYYKDHAFDKLYISTLKRTEQSVTRFINDGLNFEKLSGLDEINWGTREGKPFSPEENKYYFSMLEKWQSGMTDLPIEGGESPEEVQKRQIQALDYILSKKEEKRVLICMHGRAMRILLSTLFSYPLRNMDVFSHTNLGLYQVVYLGKHFQLKQHNEISHLDSIQSA